MHQIVKKYMLSLGTLLTMAQSVYASSTTEYQLLTGGKGDGYCTLSQQGSSLTATVQVSNLTPQSATTIWIKGDGDVIGQLSGVFSNASGEISVQGAIPSTQANEIVLDVRDHERRFSDIIDANDLKTELSQPRSNNAASISTKMGTCSFQRAATDKQTGEEIYNTVATHTTHTWLELPAVPAGTSSLEISAKSGTGGDISLYMKENSAAQTDDYDYISNNTGNDESIRISVNGGEQYHVLVHASAEYYDVKVTVIAYK